MPAETAAIKREYELFDLQAPDFFPGFPSDLEDAKAFLIGVWMDDEDLEEAEYNEMVHEIMAIEQADELNERLLGIDYELRSVD